jgi:hypothetical protein
MESLPDYDAISYVWGDPTDTSPLECSGKTLSITKNLHSALRHFRFQDQPRVLWADAICINQVDVHERGQQVSIMRVIYQRAQRVLIWLGTETEDDKDALNVIERIKKILPTPPLMGPDQISQTNSVSYNLSIALTLMWNKIPDKDWAQLGILLRRPWFERVWVIQEVLSAREALVFNGLKSISFSTLVTAASQLARGHNRFPCDGENIAENIQSLVFLGRSQSFPAFHQMIFRNFYMALWATRSYKSTDARDKYMPSSGFPWILPYLQLSQTTQ